MRARAPPTLLPCHAQVLAIYFGGEWCPHCVTYKPVVDRAYQALGKAPNQGAFEIIYVSSDQDQVAPLDGTQ